MAWVLFSAGLAAATDAAAAQEERATHADLAPPQSAGVTLDGRVLFKVRGVTAFPAEERAKLATQRLESVASDKTLPLDALHIEEMPDRSVIRLAQTLVVTVFDPDAELEGIPRHLLAESYLKRIKDAIAAYRHDHSPRVLALATLYALGATTALVLIVWVLVLLFRRFDRWVESRYRTKVKDVRIASFQIMEAARLWEGVQASQRLLRRLGMLILVFVYLEFVLGLYPWTRHLADRMLALLLDPLRAMGMGIIHAAPGLIFVLILIVVLRYVLKVMKLYFSGLATRTFRIHGFDPDWAMPTYRIFRLGIVAFGIVLAYPHVPGSQSEAFKGVSILLGVIVSLGSSSAVANIIAGYMMIYRRAFRVGDRIKIDDFVGDVTEVRLQVTHLRSLKNEEITIPNSTILNSSITNFSTLARDRGLILHTTVGIGYETPWRQVEAMLLEAATRTPGLLREPAPFVLQRSLDDFAVTYELNAYTDQPQESVKVYSLLHQNILDLFNEHGVQIMTPAYEGDPQSPKIVPKDQWFAPPAKHPSSGPAS
ncbi:mechanosensitive ion channel protein [Nitrospira sp.]|nr:mechanosensitive ion channel protein [Nitrospira sp.]